MAIPVLGGDYAHTRGVSGMARGLELDYRPSPAPEIYRMIFSGAAFSAAEFSLSAVMMLHERGGAKFKALPVFPNRAFRQASLLVRRGDPRRDPADFAGGRIGVIDYSMTAAVWARAILLEHGLDPATLRWTVAGAQRFPLPAGIAAESTDRDLEDLLAEGRLDLLIHPHARDARLPQDQRRSRPLLTNPETFERQYFAETRIFPINHTLVVHDAAHPDLPAALAERYALAKAEALNREPVALLPPWSPPAPMAAFGGDPLPYGLTPQNRTTIALLGEHLIAQGLLRRPPDIDAIFLPV